jgi:hypothetical protein
MALSVLSVTSLPEVYQTEADRQARAELMTNPGTAAISGAAARKSTPALWTACRIASITSY